MGDWVLSFVVPFASSVGALVIAFDYRNLGLRAYDLMARWVPGGVNPRFSPDVLRVIVGFFGVVLLVAIGAQAVDRL
ncbi:MULTISPECIES: hypothetical protein [Streptomyces]|uniref:Uncharacterized protein n=1 Tax=Streptomyces venezuelae TaxID=54571 RepID=A0A5P2ATQ2_STRVZ|nr:MULTISPECIES: hypothetical protein [Streptomyces]QES20980.1 hypothetical protein DEJ46_19235 [Streptomyces venezuelae]GGW02361.1 hypothetical protein GCM10010230_35230 [Streptomyces narbonensis]